MKIATIGENHGHTITHSDRVCGIGSTSRISIVFSLYVLVFLAIPIGACAHVSTPLQEITASPSYPDVHYLPIDRPGLLRPDAVRLIPILFRNIT